MRKCFIIEFKQFDYEEEFDRRVVIVADSEEDAETAFYVDCPRGDIGTIEEVEYIDFKGIEYDTETGERYLS